MIAIAVVIMWATILGISPGLMLIGAALAGMLLNAMPHDQAAKVVDQSGRKA